MDYLLKTEPSEYAFADLQRDRETSWMACRIQWLSSTCGKCSQGIGS